MHFRQEVWESRAFGLGESTGKMILAKIKRSIKYIGVKYEKFAFDVEGMTSYIVNNRSIENNEFTCLNHACLQWKKLISLQLG